MLYVKLDRTERRNPMKHSSRRILALLLALSLCIGMMPMSIFAEPETEEINGQLEEIIELSQSPADDPADLEEESGGFDVSETDAKEAPEAVKKADVTVLEEKKVEEKKVELEKVDLDKIEKDMPSALTEALPEAGNSDAQEDEKDEGDDVAGDDTVDYTLTVIWDDDNDAAGMRPDVDKFKAAMTLSYTDGDGGRVGTFNPTPESETEVQSDRYIFTWTGLKKANSRGDLYHYFAWADIEGYTVSSSVANTLTYTLDNTAHMNFAKVWKDGEETDARPSADEYGKCVTLYQYYPKTEEIATIDTAPVVTVSESDPNIYYVTWATLPRYADGQEVIYFAKETTVPDGYLESYENVGMNNAAKAAKLPAADEAVYLKGTILNVYVGTTDFTVTVRWEDENDKYGNRPSAADFAEKMGLYLWSEINAKDYDPLHLSEREPKVTDNNDDTYTVTWENLPASFNGEDMLYIAREASPSSGYVGDYKNQLEYSGAPHLYGAYENGEIVNTTAIILFNVQKDWQDADNKDGERPDSITVHLLEGEQELASKTITEEDLWSGSFEGVYPAYRNGEPVEYAITEDPVPGYRTEIKEADYEEAAEEPDPADEEEEEAAVKKRIDVDPPEDDENSWNQVRTYKVTNIKTVDVTAIKTWDDENDADGFRPELKDFAENYLHLGVSGSSNPPGQSDRFRDERVEARLETVAKVAKVLNAVKIDGAGSDTLKPTSYSENGNIYTVVWEGLDKYDGNDPIFYSVSEDEIKGYKSSIPTNEPGEAGPVWKFTNTHKHETREFNVSKNWLDGDNKEGDRPDHITVNLIADGKVVDTLIITPNEEGFWGGSFEDSYPKYKDGKEIKYELEEVPIEGYFTIIDYAEFAHFDDGGVENPVVKKAAKSTDDSVTKGEFFVTNAKVVDVTITKIWNDDNNRDGKRPSLKRFVEAVGLELHAFVGYKDVLIEPLEEMGPVVTKCEDDSFIGDAAYTITWTNLLKYLEDDQGEYHEAGYFAKENLSKVSALGYSPSRFSVVFAPQVPPDQEAVARFIRGAANSGGSITNEYTPEKLSITITKSWADGDNPDRPESVTVNLLANGEPVFEEAAVLSAENDWTVTYDDLYEFENRKPIDYTIEEEQIEGYARPDYSKSTDEDGNILLDVCNSLPADKPFSITKRWADNNNEDGNRPTPEELIENGAFVLRRTTDPKGEKYEYPDSFDPEIVDNGNNTYTVTWKDLPKYDKSKEKGNVWLYSVGEYDFNTYQTDANIGTGYYLTSSTIGRPDPTDWESNSFPMENNKHTWVYNGGSFTNTYQRRLMELDIKKIWDDNDNEHGKRPDSITVVLFEEIDGSEETVRTVTITPDEKGEWIVTLKDLQRYRNGEEIQYDIEELEVEGYITTYKNSLKPDPVDPSDPNNPFIDPDELEPGEVIGPVIPGWDDWQQEFQDQKEYKDDLKKAAKSDGTAVSKPPRVGVVIDQIPQQNVFVVETITITNTEYCTATWVDENGTPITPTEDGKFEPVNFPYNAEEDVIPADDLYGDGPEKDGYTFAGWEKIENEDEDGNKTGDITYKATYTQDPIVRYHSNYPPELEKTDLMKDESYSEKEPYTIADLERVGFEDLLAQNYAFRGWTTNADGTGVKYAAGADYPEKASAAGSSAVSFALMGIRSAASSSRAAGDPTIELELWAQWEKVHVAKWVDEDGETPIEGFDPIEITDPDNPPADDTYGPAPDKDGYTFTGWDKIEEDGDIIYVATYEPDEEGNELVTVIWKDYDGTELYSGDYPTVPAAEDYNEESGNDNPTRPEDNDNTYTFNGWVKSDGPNGEVIYTAQYTATPKTPTNPGRPGNPSNPKTDDTAEDVSEIENSETPLAPATEEPVEEASDEEFGDPETPLAGYEAEPEEDDEIAEEATPFSPYTGDDRNTVVWGIVSILSLLGIVLVARRRKEE